MRRTRILATLGPASDGDTTIRALIDAGADAFRLNFSHGTPDGHRDVCRRIRAAASAARRPVAVMQDLAGPKIRIGPVPAPLVLQEGEMLRIESGAFDAEPGRVSCTADALFTSVVPGQHVLLDDGRIELEVTSVATGAVDTRVIAGGPLSSHKAINLPGATMRLSALTPKDAEDLRAGLEMGVDLVALSFVQSADDVKAARAVATAAGAPGLPIFAKIEKPAAVERIDEILAAADGIMIARGDLGIELPLETLPTVQKALVLAARRVGAPVIVATEVLESMRVEPRPTRAEVTDAAHAVDEGADAIMLAGETAVGRYPVKAVKTLAAIVQEAERAAPAAAPPPDLTAGFPAHGLALCEAAVTLARRAKAAALVAVTRAGKTARSLAALRPDVPIFAATPTPETVARLALVWGVTPVLTAERSVAAARQTLLARGDVPSGSIVVFVSVHPVPEGEQTNFVHVEQVS